MNFAFNVDNVKTIYSTFSLTIMAEDISNYGQELFISATVAPENIEKSIGLYFWELSYPFCASIFCKSRVLHFTKLLFSIFVIFLCFCKAPILF